MMSGLVPDASGASNLEGAWLTQLPKSYEPIHCTMNGSVLHVGGTKTMERTFLAEPASSHEPINLKMERPTLDGASTVQESWFAPPSTNQEPYQGGDMLLTSNLDCADRDDDWQEMMRLHRESEEAHLQYEEDGDTWELSDRFDVSDRAQSAHHSGSSSRRNVCEDVKVQPHASKHLPGSMSYLTGLHKDWEDTPINMEVDESPVYFTSKPCSMLNFMNSESVDRGMVNVLDHNMSKDMKEASSYFNSHVYLDEGVKLFHCTACGHKLPSAAALLRHIISHHPRESGVIQSKIVTSWTPCPQSEMGVFQCDFSGIPPVESKEDMPLLQTDDSPMKMRITEGGGCKEESCTDNEEPVFQITNVRSLEEDSSQGECSNEQDPGVGNQSSSLQGPTPPNTCPIDRDAGEGDKITYTIQNVIQERQKEPGSTMTLRPTRGSFMPPKDIQERTPSVTFSVLQNAEAECDKSPDAAEQTNHIRAEEVLVVGDVRITDILETRGQNAGPEEWFIEHEGSVQKRNRLHNKESHDEVGEVDDEDEDVQYNHKRNTNGEIPKDEPVFRCFTCNKEFHTEHLLRIHLNTHLMTHGDGHCSVRDDRLRDDGLKLTSGSSMGKATSTPQQIQHMKGHTPAVARRSRGSAKSLKVKQNIESDMESQVNQTRKCPICKAIFTSSFAFVLHMSLHTKEQPMDLSTATNRATPAASGRHHSEVPCKDALLEEDTDHDKEQGSTQKQDGAEDPIAKSQSPTAKGNSVAGASGGVSDVAKRELEQRAAWLKEVERERDRESGEEDYKQLNTMKGKPISLRRLTKMHARHIRRVRRRGKLAEEGGKTPIAHSMAGKIKSYPCPQCKLVFPDTHSLVIHMAIHTDKYKSMYKHQVRAEKSVKKNPIVSHVPTLSTDEPYKCRYCDDTFKDKKTRTLHMDRVHADQWSYMCSVCHETFRRQRKLWKHMEQHVPNLDQNTTSEESPPEGSQSDSLKEGDILPKPAGSGSLQEQSTIATSHPLVPPHGDTSSQENNHESLKSATRPKDTYSSAGVSGGDANEDPKVHVQVCTQSGGVSNLSVAKDEVQISGTNVQHDTPSTMKNGVMNANPSTGSSNVPDPAVQRIRGLQNTIAENNVVIECLLCLGQFTGRQEFNKHMEIHIGKNTYPCHLCDETFDTSDELEEHQLIHGKAAKYRRRTAAYINAPVDKKKVFRSEYTKTQEGASTQAHECSLCRVRCSSMNAYVAHMLTHSSNFQQKSQGCAVTFPQNELLQEHLQHSSSAL